MSDQRGHSSIVLTADTYVSVLPAGVRDVVENVAKLVLDHGLRVPGQPRSRRRFEAHSVVRMSAAARRAGSPTGLHNALIFETNRRQCGRCLSTERRI